MSKSSNVLSIEVHEGRPDIGLDQDYLETMSELLSDILGSTYNLVIKSHLYHWNVVGPLFKPLHELTEEHYGALFAAADVIAERIRALGHLAPTKFGAVAKFSPTARDVNHRSAADVVADLVSEHEAATKAIRKAAIKAGDADDKATEDMLTARLAFHEKAIWMLRATSSD